MTHLNGIIFQLCLHCLVFRKNTFLSRSTYCLIFCLVSYPFSKWLRLNKPNGPKKMGCWFKAVCGYLAGPNGRAVKWDGYVSCWLPGPWPSAVVSIASPCMETVFPLRFSVQGLKAQSFLSEKWKTKQNKTKNKWRSEMLHILYKYMYQLMIHLPFLSYTRDEWVNHHLDPYSQLKCLHLYQYSGWVWLKPKVGGAWIGSGSG